MYSIVVPVFNEAESIKDALQALQVYRQQGHELIVVDGGSTDDTARLAAGHVDKLVHAAKGRAKQMNAGAKCAVGDILIFLHVDTRLPPSLDKLANKLVAKPVWGYFRVRLSGQHYLLRVIEYCMNLRSRLTSIATGYQCLFIDSGLFFEAGAFPEIPLMEDIAFCKQLRRRQRPLLLDAVVVTSSRRWEKHGIISTVLEMWLLRFLYFIGISPGALAGFYYPDAKR